MASGIQIASFEYVNELFWNTIDFSIFHSDSRWTESNTFLKSIKFITIGLWNSMHRSIMFLRVNICSLQDLAAQKPARSSLSVTSTADLLRNIID